MEPSLPFYNAQHGRPPNQRAHESEDEAMYGKLDDAFIPTPAAVTASFGWRERTSSRHAFTGIILVTRRAVSLRLRKWRAHRLIAELGKLEYIGFASSEIASLIRTLEAERTSP
jgi:hypothetical protein